MPTKDKKCCRKPISLDKYFKMIEDAKKKFINKKSTNSFVEKNKLTTRNRIYHIVDNGGISFKVIINNEGISVYKTILYKDKDGKLKGEFGKEPALKITKFLGYWKGVDTGPINWPHNSLLVQLSKKKYMFIGWQVETFTTTEPIIDYTSYLGNNDVPYPIAYGNEKVYLTIEHIEIAKKDLPFEVNLASDIYREYYDNKKLKSSPMKNVKIIIKRISYYN